MYTYMCLYTFVYLFVRMFKWCQIWMGLPSNFQAGIQNRNGQRECVRGKRVMPEVWRENSLTYGRNRQGRRARETQQMHLVSKHLLTAELSPSMMLPCDVQAAPAHTRTLKLSFHLYAKKFEVDTHDKRVCYAPFHPPCVGMPHLPEGGCFQVVYNLLELAWISICRIIFQYLQSLRCKPARYICRPLIFLCCVRSAPVNRSMSAHGHFWGMSPISCYRGLHFGQDLVVERLGQLFRPVLFMVLGCVLCALCCMCAYAWVCSCQADVIYQGQSLSGLR